MFDFRTPMLKKWGPTNVAADQLGISKFHANHSFRFDILLLFFCLGHPKVPILPRLATYYLPST